MDKIRIVRKLFANHAVTLLMVIPNLLINGGTQLILDIGFHWSGFLSILAWMIGGGLSLEYGILLSTFTRSNFKIGKWRYSYSIKDEKS